ncbi:MAG: hypothetical protein KDB90_16775 [Planctomycetes bacterium]|nr:hypothetical protein [Planctomycetota bacterium]
MKSTLWLGSLCAVAMLLAACGDGGGFGYSGGPPSGYNSGGVTGGGSAPLAQWQMTENALVTAGLVEQSPTQLDTFNHYVGLSHLGVASVTRGYEFSTPANVPFSFNVIARELTNTGIVSIKAGDSASANAESIQSAGMLLDAPELSYGGTWWHAYGDGVLALAVRGSISASKVLIFETTTSSGTEVIAVRIKIGGYSSINIVGGPGTGAGVISRNTIYSSNESGFGLPAIAVSGNRYSCTAYDGSYSQGRMRTWLQYDAQTGAVTGGEASSVSPDSGSWRDQEIAALNNVLAVAYTGNSQVQVEISLDRGATFGSAIVLNESTSAPVGSQRLVQIELAQDYTLAVAYWRMLHVGSLYSSELCVAEATPTGFDANNTPTGYAFAAPWVVRSVNAPVVPLVMDLEYSSAGDLVVAYAYNQTGMGTMTLFSRCATRLSIGTTYDYLIDAETSTWGCDPSVSIIGSGVGMRIFYAYEYSGGVRVVELVQFGAAPIGSSNAATIGLAGAYAPSVHARMQNGQLRLDLLYLAPAAYGWSLRRMHFDNWDGTSAFTSDELFTCTTQGGGTTFLGSQGMVVNTVGFMGYDSVTDGDDVAVVVHTEKLDLYAGVVPQPGIPPMSSPTYFGSGTTSLLPGMTGSVPAPNSNHANQLEVIVLD